MAQSVKPADDIMALVGREADLTGRTVANQVTHWLKIVRAAEHPPALVRDPITVPLEDRRGVTKGQADKLAF